MIRKDSFCVVKSLPESKNTATHMELVWTFLHSLRGVKNKFHNPEDKQSKVTITESNLSASSENTNTHACAHAHTHASLMHFTSKSCQFSDDIHTPPGSNSISLPPYQLLNILSSIPPPPSSPPRDRCSYHFCQSQFPSAFVIPAHIYELSIVVSGCKITDVLWGGIGWDYLGLSINAYSHSNSLPPAPLPPHKSQSIVQL